jgi:hypothetical protein
MLLITVLSEDLLILAACLDVLETCVELLDQLGVLALLNSKAVTLDVSGRIGDYLELDLTCLDSVTDNREVLYTSYVCTCENRLIHIIGAFIVVDGKAVLILDGLSVLAADGRCLSGYGLALEILELGALFSDDDLTVVKVRI